MGDFGSYYLYQIFLEGLEINENAKIKRRTKTETANKWLISKQNFDPPNPFHFQKCRSTFLLFAI